MSSDDGKTQPIASPAMTVEQHERAVLERTSAMQDSNQHLGRETQRLTDREATLHESEEQFRTIFEQLAACCAKVGLDGSFLSVNPRICELFGYTRDELLAKRWADLTHPADVARNTEIPAQVLSGEISSYHTKKRYIRRDGSEFWGDLTSSLIRTAAGEPKYFASVIVDISQQRHAEDHLRKNEERLQSILNHTTAVIYIKDAGGHYELINRRFEELFHLTNQQIAGRTDFEIFPHEWAQKFRLNDLRVLETRLPWELEEVVPQDDGLHTYLSIKVPMLDETGRAVAICGISTDITERKKAESAIHRAKEVAEQASSEKSRFLANISHEIRTPIMAMLGAAELIQGDELAGNQIHEHGNVILRSGRHLLTLVDDLLDQSRIDTGRLDVVRDFCCLPEIMADVYAVAAPFLKHQVDLQIIYEKSIPEFINTDRTRLTQALINLVHNAMKFTNRGHVHVKVRLEHVEDSPFLTTCVEDTGQGIAHTDLNRIFEPFTQLGTGSQQPTSGMGLGLPLARWIARRLGGSLDVCSTPGKGSVFTLRIPVGPLVSGDWISPEEAGRWGRAQSKKNPGPPMTLCGTVLLADDSEDVQRLLTYALQKAGATVVAVSDGRAALEAVRQRPFDLILLDIRMPELNGLEAAKAIRLDGFSGPMIALTASTTKAQHDQALQAGFDDLWSKPISLERLIELTSAFLPSSPAPKEQNESGIKDRLKTVRTEFALGLPRTMDRLQKALETGDNDTAGEILHQVLGSSGILGFMDLSAQVQVVYARCKSGQLAVHSAELNRLFEIARNISL